jgi:hypothetical protein
MSQETISPPATLFDRTFGTSRPLYVKLLVGLVLLGLPFVAATLDGVLREFVSSGTWRMFILPPTIILYIWLLAPIMTRVSLEVVESLRPVVDLDEQSFDRLVAEASFINPRKEGMAFAVGFLLGILSAIASGLDAEVMWLSAYILVSNSLMYGLLAWIIYGSVASTRVHAELHQQKLHFDILDASPFNAIGRQSLLLAVVFVGGITLSFLLAFQPENVVAPEFWLVYLVLIVATVLIFFLNMLPTHRALSMEKDRQLSNVQAHFRRASRSLMERMENDLTSGDRGDLAAEINALAAYEARLQAARTWPYNTTMLRTLFFSVLLPLGTMLARKLVDLLSG